MSSFKIIVVEDEKSIREMVCLYLTDAGYEVKGYEDGISALVDFDHFKPHLAILDIMMKGIDGFETLRLIREKAEIPVLMLTAKTLEKDRLKGFELGADDYIVKPFSPREVVSRVNVFIKRIYGNESSNIKSYGDLKIDFDKHILYKNDKPLEITSREYAIVEVFFNNIQMPLTRDEIITKAIGYDYEKFDRNVDVFIKNIRKKIEDDMKKPKYIKTKYGYGYVFGDEV